MIRFVSQNYVFITQIQLKKRNFRNVMVITENKLFSFKHYMNSNLLSWLISYK